MLNWLKNKLGVKWIEDELSALEGRFELSLERDPIQTIEEMLRHKLGSIDLEDVRDKVMNEDQRREFNSKVASFFKDVIEPTVKRFIIEQEQFMARKAQNMEHLAVGRGTINGLFLIQEYFERCYNEYIATLKSNESPDQSTFFPEIPTSTLVENLNAKQ